MLIYYSLVMYSIACSSTTFCNNRYSVFSFSDTLKKKRYVFTFLKTTIFHILSNKFLPCYSSDIYIPAVQIDQLGDS